MDIVSHNHNTNNFAEATVCIVKDLETDSTGGCRPVERLLEVFTTGETSGVVLNELQKEVMIVSKVYIVLEYVTITKIYR